MARLAVRLWECALVRCAWMRESRVGILVLGAQSRRRFVSLGAVLLVVGACSRSTGDVGPSAVLKPTRAPASAAQWGVSPSPYRTANTASAHYKVGAPYRIGSTWYVPREEPGYDQTGIASWYGTDFHGRATANGERFDMDGLTAAHPTLPLPSYISVTNLANNRTVLVRVNDRGPYVGGRMVDLSRAAARALGYEPLGTAQVRVRYAGRAPLDGNTVREQQFLTSQPWYGATTTVAAMPSKSAAKAKSPLYDPWGVMGPQ